MLRAQHGGAENDIELRQTGSIASVKGLNALHLPTPPQNPLKPLVPPKSFAVNATIPIISKKTEGRRPQKSWEITCGLKRLLD